MGTTLKPLAWRSFAIEEVTIPFPNPDIIEPVITMNLVFFSGIGKVFPQLFLIPDSGTESMDKKYLKWSLLGPVVLFGLAIIGVLIYLLSSLLLSAIGMNTSPLPPLAQAFQTFLGVVIMTLIVLAALVLSLSWLVAIIDIATSSTLKGNDKIIWIVVVLFLSIIGVVAYYLVVRRAQN
jgi:hypothetical protein